MNIQLDEFLKTNALIRANSRVNEQHHQDPRLSFNSSPVTTVPPLKDKHYPEASQHQTNSVYVLFDIDRLIEGWSLLCLVLLKHVCNVICVA